MKNALFSSALVLLTSGLVACGATTTTFGGGGDGGSSATSDGGTSATGDGPVDAHPDGGTPIEGAKVSIKLKGSTEPFAHADAFASQTPIKQSVAVSSLRLYRDANDDNPLLVFDHGDKPVEAPLITGETTTLAEVARAGLVGGAYKLARVGIRYVAYRIKGRLHPPGYPAIDGEYESLQVMSDGTTVDGKSHDKGWFKTTFFGAGQTFGPNTGDNMPLPVMNESGGIGLDTSGAETAYRFPVDVVVEPTGDRDVDVVLTINVDEDFRWQDQAGDGYGTGVFDTTPTTFETVMQFGANAFDVTVAEK